MRRLAFLIISFGVLRAGLIEEEQERPSPRANPLVVEKLLEKLGQYSDRVSAAQENLVRKEDLFEKARVPFPYFPS